MEPAARGVRAVGSSGLGTKAVNDGTRAALQSALAQRGTPPEAVQAMKPWLVSLKLTMAQLALSRMIDIAMTCQPGPETTAEAMCCRALLGRGARAASTSWCSRTT